MSGVRIILLPHGTTYVTVEAVPQLIALALYPESTEDMTVGYLRKAESLPGGVTGGAADLEPEDWEELRKAWAYLPPYRDGLSQSTWLAYQAAFNLFSPHLPWKPVPFWKGGPAANAIGRLSAEEEHRRYLRDAIERGEVVTRNHAIIPLPALEGTFPHARILLAEVTAYCTKFSVAVQVAPLETPAPPGVSVGLFAKDLAAQLEALFGAFWKYRGANDDLRAGAWTGRGEKEIRDAIHSMAAQGQVSLTTGAGAPVPRFASLVDDAFRLSAEDARKVVEAIVGIESLSVQYRRQELEQDAAGRVKLSELITFLSGNTGWDYKRWESVVTDAVQAKHLALRNPRNYTDRLPYAIPERVETSYEQVSVEDADAWLDSHPEWAVRFRLKGRSSPTKAPAEVRHAGASNSIPFDRVTVQDLVGKIAEVATERHPEKWQHPSDPDPLRRTIVAALNEHGWVFDGIPGILPLFLKELESKRVEAFSTFNDFPFTDISEVRANPSKWYVTSPGVAHLLGILEKGLTAPPAPDGPGFSTVRQGRQRPPSQQRFQELEILRVLSEIGHDPKALPKSAPGVEGPKAAVRARLTFTTGVFDKAWERLRKAKELRDADTP